MATPAQRTNTWILDQWYDQAVAGTQGSYTGTSEFWLWGKQESGSFGINIGGTISRSSPVQLSGNTWQTEFYNNHNQAWHQVVAKTDGTLWSWGKGSDWGQLGLNQRSPSIRYSSPVQIGSGTDWKLGGTTREGSFAVKTDGTLWGWGSNQRGEMGQNDRNTYSSPVQIPGTTWDKAYGGFTSILAIKTDGTLWGIGEGGYGRLAQNNQTVYSSPVQIPGTWSSASMDGAYGVGAINTDGELYMWGYNSSGVLAQNDQISRSSPVQVTGTWSYFENAGEGAGGRKSDGTLWMWGANDYGMLGQNQAPTSGLPRVSSPVQIPGTSWNRISFSGRNGAATKTDGTLWSWGDNSQGHCAQNNTTPGYSSPVQIPGTSWLTVGHGGQGNTVMATKNI